MNRETERRLDEYMRERNAEYAEEQKELARKATQLEEMRDAARDGTLYIGGQQVK